MEVRDVHPLSGMPAPHRSSQEEIDFGIDEQSCRMCGFINDSSESTCALCGSDNWKGDAGKGILKGR